MSKIIVQSSRIVKCEVIRMGAGRGGRKDLNLCGYLTRMEEIEGQNE